jgi:rubrerythrin
MKAPSAKLGTDPRGNRTGAESADRVTDSVLLVSYSLEAEPSSHADGNEVAAVRKAYASIAEPVGHVDPRDAWPERSPEHLQFLDKLGERLAFERAGVRLYEALLVKIDAPPVGAPTLGRGERELLARICLEEHEHYLLLQQAIQEVGGDPSCLTPSADVAGVMMSGLPKVLLDPRTTVAHGLDAILVAELADNDAWERLEEMAEARGLASLAMRFAEALEHEQEHLETVRDLSHSV